MIFDLDGLADRFDRMGASAVERVDPDHERHVAGLEVVDRREAVAEPSRVGQDHGADRPTGQFVPH